MSKIEEKLSKAAQIVKDINQPSLSNTEMFIACVEELARRRGNDIVYESAWMEVKSIMRLNGYDAQSIMREHRRTKDKKPKHAELEEEHRDYYTTHVNYWNEIIK